MIKIEMERTTGEYGFTVTEALGHQLKTDAGSSTGGEDSGFRPMQLVLAALGSCSAIDLVSILKKQRQEISDFKIVIVGEREEGKIPSLWKQVHMQFHLIGAVDQEKARKAAALSIDKYCSVAETLRRGGTDITWEINVNQE
jgi:putative redox protein